MNRKVMRKSTLISSIAMLLVAVVALSGVTFAWFSSNPTANTKKVTMTSTGVKGVNIVDADIYATERPNQWLNNLNWETTIDMAPASCAFQNMAAHVAPFYTTTTNSSTGEWDKSAGISNAVFTDGSVKENVNVFAKRVWVKADFGEETPAQDLVVNISLASSRNYTRLAIVNKTAKTFTVFTATERVTEKPILCFSDDQGNGVDISANTKVAGEEILVPNYNSGDIIELEVYFYFEGQDPDCVNKNSSAEASVEMTFELQAHPTQQG